MIRWVTIAKFFALSGYSDAAVRGKIREAVWLEGKHWKRAPDGHILINLEAYDEWVTNGNGLVCAPQQKAQSKLTSVTKELDAGKGSSCRLRPLT